MKQVKQLQLGVCVRFLMRSPTHAFTKTGYVEQALSQTSYDVTFPGVTAPLHVVDLSLVGVGAINYLGCGCLMEAWLSVSVEATYTHAAAITAALEKVVVVEITFDDQAFGPAVISSVVLTYEGEVEV